MSWLTEYRMSRTVGVVLQIIIIPAFHAGVPWWLSLLSVRHGWLAGRPGILNLLGLIPVAAGFYLLFLCLREHFVAAPKGWKFEKTPVYPTPPYLITGGPYRYSRHPIYLGEGAIWVGWIIFFGSLAVLAAFVAMGTFLGPVIVRREERGLEARFGDVYREYKRSTPRWIRLR